MNPIYVAIDTGDVDRAEVLARAVAPHIGGLKLGLEFFMAQGPGGVRRMAKLGLPIFLDVKLHDIPNTVAGAMRSLSPLDLGIVNVHAGGGAAMMRAARDAMRPETKVIGVTVLTSIDETDLESIGVMTDTAAQVARLANLCKASGLNGIVCSGFEVAARHTAWPEGMFIVPGLRSDGKAQGDQKRVMTPRDALDAGASILVIGRPITGASDPAEAARAIAATL
ncbi:Orotidine 5'-phosphate decarboxylase [Sphingomonas antarctica]|uniref:orotidine-5'-phosphate decarboxylase n=1 Tax=Sphingomonas antarctica TaxID=2040274 RepID=UPI0039EB5ADF